jgi:hypothetical protein
VEKMTLLPSLLLLSILSLIVVISVSTNADEVWRDKALRYSGFRYEISVENSDFDYKALLQSRAESFFCFGWVQDSPRGTIVGEARW